MNEIKKKKKRCLVKPVLVINFDFNIDVNISNNK